MPSSGMLYYVAFIRTDVSNECITSIIKVTRIGVLGKKLAVISNRSTQSTSTKAHRMKVTDLFANFVMLKKMAPKRREAMPV
jgi:hypothetical protein